METILSTKGLFGRKTKDVSRVASLFLQQNDILSDVRGLDYNKYFSKRDVRLEPLGPAFIDTVVVVCPINLSNIKDDISPEVSTHNLSIRSLMNNLGLDKQDFRCIGTNTTPEYETISREEFVRYRDYVAEPLRGDWKDGQVAFKIDFGNVDIDVVLGVLKHLPTFNNRFIYLRETDITRDYKGSMDRAIVRDDLISQGFIEQGNIDIARTLGAPGCILDNTSKVGEQCITWMDRVAEFIRRCKQYNKPPQMWESPSVRKCIGTNVPSYVANPSESFQRKLMDGKDTGIVRLECTIYSSKLQSKDTLIQQVDDMLKYTDKAYYYHTSYEAQWRALTEVIKASMFIYMPDSRILAYCQWLNSLTGKVQGLYKENVSRAEMEWVRSAYSFNERPIYYLEMEYKEDKRQVVFLAQEIYMRQKNGITLVPGGKKSLFPSWSTASAHAVSFQDMGMVTCNNVNIDWPQKRKTENHGHIVPVALETSFKFIIDVFGAHEKERKVQEIGVLLQSIRDARHRAQLKKQEDSARLHHPIGDSKFIYKKLVTGGRNIISCERLQQDVPYHVYGTFENKHGVHALMIDPVSKDVLSTAFTDSGLLKELRELRVLVPKHNAKDMWLYTCGKPFLYITVSSYSFDVQGNKKPDVVFSRTQSNEEIQATLSEFFSRLSIASQGQGRRPDVSLVEDPRSPNYKSDKDLLVVGKTYTVRAYGIKIWRNNQTFFIILKDKKGGLDVKVRAGRKFSELMQSKMQAGPVFQQFNVTSTGLFTHDNNTVDVYITEVV